MATRKKQTKRWKRILKRIVLTILLLAVLAVAGLIGWSSLKAKYTVTYTGYNATIGSISNSLSFSGSLALVDSKTYQASAAATVRAVYAEAGERVKKGDRLVRLSTGETIKADFDGTVNTMNVAKDDDVAAGDTLCQIADFDNMTVSVRVDEYDIGSVHVGDECRVTVTATEQQFMSSIGKINYISASTGNVAYYTATCSVNVSEGVYPGMQVSVTIPQESAENVVVLKQDALGFDERNSAYVMMYNDEQELERHDVEVGVSNGNYVEIRSGLNAGDTAYVEVKTAGMSEIAAMMSSMFGSQRVMNQGGRGSNGSWQQRQNQNGTAPGGNAGGGR